MKFVSETKVDVSRSERDSMKLTWLWLILLCFKMTSQKICIDFMERQMVRI